MLRKASYIIMLLCAIAGQAQSDTVRYSFFAAGHTYGNPNSPGYGLHVPFVDYIPTLNDDPKMELGFFTGDVVVQPTTAYWDSAEADLALLDMPFHIAPGNHDGGQEFLNRFGTYYTSFIHRGDLFITLNPDQNWSITGAQLTFLQNTLDTSYTQVERIFIFLHELVWWSPDNYYQDVDINYEPHYPGTTNWDTVVKPLLLSYPNPITLYAGDVGCINQVSPFMFHRFENLTLIASGMGGGVRDNIIVTKVYQDSVYYDLVHLNGADPNGLGELYEYEMGVTPSLPSLDSFELYPNPVQDGLLTIWNGYDEPCQLRILDTQGKLMERHTLPELTKSRIPTTHLSTGMYMVELENSSVLSTQKLVLQQK